MLEATLGQPSTLLDSDFIALVLVKDRHIVWANKAMHRIFLYSPGELLGQPTRAMFPDQASYEAFGREAYQSIAESGTYAGVIPQKRKDGTTGWYEFSLSCLADNPEIFAGAIADRTAGEQARRQLEFSAGILSAIKDCVSIVSTDGIFRYTNAAFDKMFGYEREELVGQNVAIVNAGTDLSARQIAQGIMAALDADGAWRGDLLNRRKDGAVFWTHAHVSRLHSAEWGEVWISIQHDISERVAAERALRDREEQLDMALSGSGLVLWDWNIPTRKVSAGKRWHEMLGYANQELGSEEDDWMGLIHPRDLDRFRQNISAHLQGETAIFESEHRLRHKDGHWVTVEARGKVTQRDKDGTPLRMVGTVLDVSQRKRLNEEGVDLLRQIESLIRETTTGSSVKSQESEAYKSLTKREREILGMIAKGMTSVGIGRSLGLATNTINVHRRNLMTKLGLHGTAQAIRFAIDRGLIGQ